MWTLRIKLRLFASSRSFRLFFYPQDVPSRSVRAVCFYSRGQWNNHTLMFKSHQNKRCVHTAKGWKVLANPKLVESEDSDTPVVSCEEGTSAVSHKEVLSHLNACKTLGEQIYTLSSLLSLSAEDIENRRQFCESLTEVFRIYLPQCKVTQFGSSMNLLGFKGSDVDVCIQTAPGLEKPAEYTKCGRVPELDDVLNGSVDHTSVANLHPKLLLRFLRRTLRRHCEEVREPIIFIKARCPIVRFYHAKYDLFCDLSCENTAALLNTKLVRFIAHMDSRVCPLIQVLRYWGKIGKFVGDIDMFTSYSFSLLVVYYLQNTSPPVLPPLAELFDKAEYLKMGDADDDDLLFSSLKNIPVSENKQSIETLLREFFYFYTFYDYKQVMLVSKGSSVPFQDFRLEEQNSTGDFGVGSVLLQDPVRLTLNATSCLGNRAGVRFLSSLLEACILFQNNKLLSPNSESENWGISQLFESSLTVTNDIISAPEVLVNSITIDFPSRCSVNENQDVLVEASHLVKKILEHCFLFECKDLSIKPRHYEALPLLKFSCEAVHNTWTGRSEMSKAVSGRNVGMTTLEFEHAVSLELTQHKDFKSAVLSRFVCECYSVEDINSSNLKVNFKFESGKLPVAIYIFLKEHIPRILKRTLNEKVL